MKSVWEVTVTDQAYFGDVVFNELFASEKLARKVGDQELQSYRDDQDEEFKSSIVLDVVEREVLG